MYIYIITYIYAKELHLSDGSRHGFAPHADKELCFLSGCMKTTVEKWAKDGSWVIGIGGNNTGKPDKLIYVMEVKHTLPFKEFKVKYPSRGDYLEPKKRDRMSWYPVIMFISVIRQ